MSWHALDAFDDAVAATRGFLLPLELSRWWRLAVVVLLLGGSGGGLNSASNAASGIPSDLSGTSGLRTTVVNAVGDASAVAIAAVAAVVSLVLALTVLSQAMRFVLVDAIERDEVRLRRVVARLVDGLRLLALTLGVYLLLAGVVVGLAVAADAASVTLDDVGAAGIVVAAVAVVAVVVALTAFFHFTNELVVPTMVARDCGVLPAWRRFAGRLRAQPGQLLLYLFVRAFVNLGVGVVVGLVAAILGGVVLLVGAVAGGGVVVAVGGTEAVASSLPALAVVGLVAVVTVLVLLLGVVLPLRVVGRTFTTTYALSVLGRVDPGAAVLPDGGWDDGPEDTANDPEGLATERGTDDDDVDDAGGATDGVSTDDAGDAADTDDVEADGDADDELGGFEFGER